jgi:hypothetical protein
MNVIVVVRVCAGIVLGLRPSLFGDCSGFLRKRTGFHWAYPNNTRTKSTAEPAQYRGNMGAICNKAQTRDVAKINEFALVTHCDGAGFLLIFVRKCFATPSGLLRVFFANLRTTCEEIANLSRRWDGSDPAHNRTSTWTKQGWSIELCGPTWYAP